MTGGGWTGGNERCDGPGNRGDCWLKFVAVGLECDEGPACVGRGAGSVFGGPRGLWISPIDLVRTGGGMERSACSEG